MHSTHGCSPSLVHVSSPLPAHHHQPVYMELQQRLMQRESLVQMRIQVSNQLHALLRQPTVIASVQKRVETLIARP